MPSNDCSPTASAASRSASPCATRASRASWPRTTGTDDLSAEGATAGAVSGAGVGALIGLALVGSTLVIPGVGPVLIGGSLATGAVTSAGTAAAALTGAGIGGVSGGLIGGLVGAGIPEDEASGLCRADRERPHPRRGQRRRGRAAPAPGRSCIQEGRPASVPDARGPRCTSLLVAAVVRLHATNRRPARVLPRAGWRLAW